MRVVKLMLSAGVPLEVLRQLCLRQPYMSYSLNSLQGCYIGQYYRGCDLLPSKGNAKFNSFLSAISENLLFESSSQ